MAPRAPTVALRRMAEPVEQAFTVLVPDGWQIAGGIMRADHMTQRVTWQTVEAKCDFAIMRDPHGTAMIRWCPTTKFCDLSQSATPVFGFFPPGSDYGGQIVWPLLPAADFLTQILFPWAHPQATGAEVLEQRSVPEAIERCNRRQAALNSPVQVTFDAAVVTLSYTEGGVRYKEKAYTVIENLGPLALGAWCNRETVFSRAPADEYDALQPLFSHIQGSLELNPLWVQQEQMSQAMLAAAFQQGQRADQMRAQRALDTQRYIQNVAREIVEHRQNVNAEIRNDMYLMLSGQEEYVNPYTRKIDTGSNEWKHRWVTENGDEFYTDDPDYNPNDDEVLKRSDWKRSEVRPRYPDGPLPYP